MSVADMCGSWKFGSATTSAG